MAKVSLGEFQENTKLSLAGDDRCEIRQGGQDCKDNLSRITRERSSQLEDSFGLLLLVEELMKLLKSYLQVIFGGV